MEKRTIVEIDRKTRKIAETDENIVVVTDNFEENLHQCIGRTVNTLKLFYGTIRKILGHQKFHPYKCRITQALF